MNPCNLKNPEFYRKKLILKCENNICFLADNELWYDAIHTSKWSTLTFVGIMIKTRSVEVCKRQILFLQFLLKSNRCKYSLLLLFNDKEKRKILSVLSISLLIWFVCLNIENGCISRFILSQKGGKMNEKYVL